VLVALWAALRRPLDTRVESLLWQLGAQLDEIAEQVSAAGQREGDYDAGLGDAIGSTIELDDVLRRTLVAAEALPAVDGSQVWVRRPNGTVTTVVRGLVTEGGEGPLAGPPDGGTYVSGLVSWDVDGAEALRTGLVVPLGPENGGSLAVYSRLPNAFDAEAARVLAAIARRAGPAVQNAYRFLEAQERAATDARTGLGSAGAFEEALPREISAARRHGRPLCLIQIDLDDFGAINKNHPRHLAAGDDVLTEFGERVRSTIRGSDSAFRNSGGADEFFLILPETTREYAVLLYGRLAFEVAASPFADIGTVTMSSGLAELRSDDTSESLQRRAGEAMIVAKNSGKNQLLTDADV
jgi:diguanylate cyclase (GGDEF)-like protein